VFRTDFTSVQVELRNEPVQPPAPSRLTLDRNFFSPIEDESVTIEFPPGDAGARLEIYTLMGEQVRSWDVEGDTSVTWDGRNSEHDLVASGVYLVRCGSEVRKIGVVK
jgi:hypothetical protein